MCRSIKPLFNVDPPVGNEEIREAARQFVRKVSGYRNPSKDNEVAFLEAIEELVGTTKKLVKNLKTNAKLRTRVAR